MLTTRVRKELTMAIKETTPARWRTWTNNAEDYIHYIPFETCSEKPTQNCYELANYECQSLVHGPTINVGTFRRKDGLGFIASNSSCKIAMTRTVFEKRWKEWRLVTLLVEVLNNKSTNAGFVCLPFFTLGF